jgi:hypothetical protein
MVQTFCSSGQREGVKGAVHGAACVIAATMAAYNIAAWHFRRERHLGTNAVVYTLAVAWEAKQTLRHLRRCDVAVITVRAA